MALVAIDLRHCVDWSAGVFDPACLREALNALPAGVLPLDSACTQGGLVDESARSISLLSSWYEDGRGHVRIGVFFGEVVAGCNCNDDPVTGNVYACFELVAERDSDKTKLRIVDG